MMRKICFVTTNLHKIQEVKQLLGDDMDLITPNELGFHEVIVETGLTFKENAFIKANKIFVKYNIPTIADDSGLVVKSLDDAPGVFSARFAGPNAKDTDNVSKVLELLKGNPNRNAYFETSICFISDKGIQYFVGKIDGKLSDCPYGSDGFGYDPIFIPNGQTQTFAQLGTEFKNKVSHRAIAIKEFKEHLLTTRYGF